jgi:inhibitor of cysteine peptidase
MNTKQTRWLLPLLLFLFAFVAACTPAAEETPATNTPGQPAATPTTDPNAPVSSDDPTATPTEPATTGEFQYGQAIINSVDLLTLESFPVQIHAVVRGDLPDGCTEIDEITSERQGNTFVVTITTRRPLDVACTLALVPFEEPIPLEVNGLTAGDYTVNVNGVTNTFNLPVDNILPTEPVDDGLGLAEIPLSCLSGDENRAPYINLAGGYCLQYPARFLVGDVYPQGPGGGGPQESIAAFYGPRLDNSMEPVRASLSIVVEGRDDGRTLDEWAAQATGEFPGMPITRTETTFAGQPALLLEGMPGRTVNNQLFVIHNGRVYHLTLYPVDPALPQAMPDVDEVWTVVTESFTFLPQPVIERYSACPTGGIQGDFNHAPYLNIDAGYCLAYPSYFNLQQDFVVGTAALINDYVTPGANQELIWNALTMTLQVELANGRTLAQVVDEVAAAHTGPAPLTRTPATLGGEPAELVEGFADGSRHLFAIHDDRVYHLALVLPPGEIANAAEDAARLWEAVTTSFTFVP